MIERKLRLGFPGNEKEVTVQVPDNEPPNFDLNSKLEVAGGEARRLDGPDKVSGRAKYTFDINLPGLLHAMVLRSPHPAAVIKSINTEKAMKMPGVKGIVYAFEENKIGEKLLKYAGDEILAIAADTPQHAEDAIRAVEIEYDKRFFVVDLEQARQTNSPKVHPEREDNLGRGREQGKLPEVDERLTGSFKTTEATFKTQVQTHCCLETHGLVVKPDGDRLTVWASTQGTFSVRDGLAENLNMKPEKIDVITHYMGGGFGSKFGPRPEGVMCAKLALATKQPVKLMLTRKDEHLAAGNRPNSVQNVKVGCDEKGVFTAIRIKTYGTGGIAGGAGARIPGLYEFPGVYKDETDVYTNAGPACAMRAPGHPQGYFALESIVDQLAHEMGMDPLEFRRINDKNPIRLAEYTQGAKEIGWDRRNKKAGEGPVVEGKRRGIGMASTQWYAGGGKNAHADVEIHKNGDVVLMQGAQDLGTGFRTTMAMLVAEELGLKPSDIITKVGETRYGFGPGSGGSTTTPTVAPAVHAAAYNARRKLFESAAEHLGAKPDDLDASNGKVFVKNNPDGKSLTFKQACALLPADKITAGGDRNANYAGYNDGVAGVQFAEVEVDEETGEVRVIKVVAIQDCGFTINKTATESQICGGVIQGISYALFENRIMDVNTGHQVNPNFMDYKILGPGDCPEIVPIVFQVFNGKNSVGAMGMGEPPVVPTAAAIANAIFNAIGVRVYELPMTPDKVIAALAKKGSSAVA